MPGVTSISADFHKFGYAPKGVSVLLQRGRERHRRQFFATRRWPGYPVVNPTMLGSRSATGLAAAWAVTRHLGPSGYRELVAQSRAATEAILAETRTIEGLTVMGNPTGPLFALAADERLPVSRQVDPHHFADALLQLGYQLQHQPELRQANGVRVPHSVHLTITPVTHGQLPELLPAMRAAADTVRGTPRANPRVELAALRALGLMNERASISSRGASRLLRIMGLGAGNVKLPGRMAPLMRMLEELPAAVAETILIELIAGLSEPKNSRRRH